MTDYLDHVQDKVAAKTFYEKKKAIKRLLQDIAPETPIEEVEYAQIEDHLDRIRKEVSGHRANKSRKNIIRAYNWGIKRRLVPAPNP